MNETEILNTLTRILRDLLMDDSIILTPTTRREDVPSWDSFTYINFIVAVESELGTRFNVAEVESFQTVGDIAACIAARSR